VHPGETHHIDDGVAVNPGTRSLRALAPEKAKPKSGMKNFE
jgi:hypothetical protein